MSNVEIRICGMGGQGVIKSGLVLGKAVSINEGRYATMVQSFGPEARGSACSAEVIVSDTPICYPYVRNADLFMAYSQAGYDRHIDSLKSDGILLFDEERVSLDRRVSKTAVARGIPGLRLAVDATGNAVGFNMVMLGFLAAVTDVVSSDALLAAIRDSVPEGTYEMNERAFCAGYDYGQSPEHHVDEERGVSR